MKKPILVTGSHRSGSTWVGEVIGASSHVGYIHEPFNISINRYNQPFDHWFEFISEFCGQEHQDKVEDYLKSFIGWPDSIAFKRMLNIEKLYDVYANMNDVFNLRRRFFQRTLFKDPIALLSSEWIYEKMHADILIVIRHPAAFIASLKVKNWQFDFSNFADQKNLMRVHLSDYKDVIEAYAHNQPEIVDTGIALWNALYTAVKHFEEKYQDKWYFVKHEDLSLNPIEEYKKIFSFLDLPFDKRVQDYVLKSTQAEKNSKTQRNSADNIHTWKNRLTAAEIEKIKKGTEPVWKHYYLEEDW